MDLWSVGSKCSVFPLSVAGLYDCSHSFKGMLTKEGKKDFSLYVDISRRSLYNKHAKSNMSLSRAAEGTGPMKPGNLPAVETPGKVLIPAANRPADEVVTRRAAARRVFVFFLPRQKKERTPARCPKEKGAGFRDCRPWKWYQEGGAMPGLPVRKEGLSYGKTLFYFGIRNRRASG